ncbi:MAG TPA: hypothetical protein VH351_02675 [Bryobacteraceae bacterium]|jgi:hypothetical protein|nr:hypothetical protein [Bryobacteraceae bacterium]
MAFALNDAARGERSSTLAGNNSKHLMTGPVRRADVSFPPPAAPRAPL